MSATPPSDDVIVRDARPDEHAAIRALTLAAYAEHAHAMAPAAWVALEAAVRAALAAHGPADRIVAEHAGALVGSVQLHPAETDAYGTLAERAPWPELRLLSVAPHARGLGVGRALVAECARRARAAGAHTLGLHSSRSMRPALRLYASMGFVRDPARDFQPEGAELVEGYRLELGAG